MTSISQYLRAERLDPSEPVSFYVPGVSAWEELNTPRGRAKLASRHQVIEERLYPDDPEEVGRRGTRPAPAVIN